MNIEAVLKYDLNIYAFILLLILLLIIQLKSEVYSFRNRIFRLIVVSTMVMLVLEVLSWLLDGLPGDTNFILNWAFNTLFALFGTVVASLFASYIDFVIFESVERIKKRMYYLHPTIILTILCTINIFTPILFEIDQTTNLYSRLPLIWISITLVYILYTYILLLIFKKRKVIPNKFIIGVFIFLVLPIIGTIFQLIFYGLLLIWSSASLAVVFTYLIFETTSSSRDFNTGLYTRLRCEDYISNLINRKKRFSVIMIDLDDFKEINDTYGHTAGDKALIEFAKTITKVFKDTKSMLARFGGDEFLIIVEGPNKGQLEYYKKDIYNILKTSETEYVRNLAFSFGYSICDNPETASKNDLFVEADNNMYLDKAKNKNNRRRKGDK